MPHLVLLLPDSDDRGHPAVDDRAGDGAAADVLGGRALAGVARHPVGHLAVVADHTRSSS